MVGVEVGVGANPLVAYKAEYCIINISIYSSALSHAPGMVALWMAWPTSRTSLFLMYGHERGHESVHVDTSLCM